MVGEKFCETYKSILRQELVPALGCTEPAAIAFSTWKARMLLGTFPLHIEITCSGNIVKNVKGVVVPNSGGLRGIEAAAILGAMADDGASELEILSNVTSADIEKTKSLLGTSFCKCHLEEGEGNVYIRVLVSADSKDAEVIIRGHHTNIVYLRQNHKVLLNTDYERAVDSLEESKKALNIRDILSFADTADYGDIKDILRCQIKNNMAIAEEGMKKDYGASVGRTLFGDGSDVRNVAKAKAAAGSDARMGGCSLPVVVNSGSGNQGITVTVPVVEYAKALGSPEDKLYRAILLSNLTAIHIKRYMGSLSAFCGAVSAGCASGAAITYLHGGDYETISSTIINTLANLSGVICDGAKSSCAAKIASSVDAAIMAHEMTMKGKMFQFGEGLVMGDVERTIENIGHIGKEGMRETDIEILHLMLEDGCGRGCV